MGKRTFDDVKDSVAVYLEREKEMRHITQIYDFLFREELIGSHMHMSTQRLAGLLSKDKQNRFKRINKPRLEGGWVLNES